MEHVPFPDIEGLHNVVRYAEAFPGTVERPVQYKAKIKLHGMNAAVRIKDGLVFAQSRSTILTPAADLAGFARWVEDNSARWSECWGANGGEELTIFGEWCGPGVVKGRGAAISKIGDKIFAPFVVLAGAARRLVIAPERICDVLADARRMDRLRVLPWLDVEVEIDYKDGVSVQKAADLLNQKMAAIEKCDPWVKEEFGVEGEAEGFVCYPVGVDLDVFSNFAFKVKAEKHRVNVQKKAVQVAPEVAASIDEFVRMFVTEARLEQGLGLLGGKAVIGDIVKFLDWVAADVEKESAAELAASGLAWMQARSKVVQAARLWFVEQTKK